MAAPANCCTTTCTTEIVNVPGIEGAAGVAGAAGTDGVNAFTVTTVASAVPAAAGDSVTVSVEDSTWAVVNQVLIVAGPSHYRVVSKPSSTSLELLWLDYPNDVAGGVAIASGTQISPSGEQPAGYAAAGSPEGAVVASPGATYLNTTDDSFWVKKTGTLTNTGWIAIVTAWLLMTFNLFGAPPVVRQQFTTNLQTAVMTLSTNVSRFVATNDVSVLTLLTNISRFVLTSNNVFSGSNYMIGTFVGNGNSLTNFGSNQFNGKFVGSGISLTNAPVNVGTNATAVSGNITIYFTNQDGRVYRVAAEAL